jgi:beta-hydroxylase
MYIFSKVPNQPYIDTQHFKDLKVLDENWEMIRDEAKALYERVELRHQVLIMTWGLTHFLKQAGSVLSKMV